MHRFVLPAVFAVVLVTPALAGQEEAVKVDVHGDDTAALETFMRRARTGDARAAFALGVRYSEGRGVPRDEHRSTYWLRLAATQGEPAAKFLLDNSFTESCLSE